MALSERNRRILSEHLSDVVGDQEAVDEMLSNFPDDDADRPATRQDLDDLRADTRLDGLDSGLSGLRTDMLLGFAQLRTEASDRETRMMGFVHAEVQTATRWTIGFLVSSQAVLVAALAAFG